MSAYLSAFFDTRGELDMARVRRVEPEPPLPTICLDVAHEVARRIVLSIGIVARSQTGRVLTRTEVQRDTPCVETATCGVPLIART